MAKKAYIGVDGVARKVKKGYIGIEGLAHKIKKAYIGIGGVARLCWSAVEPFVVYLRPNSDISVGHDVYVSNVEVTDGSVPAYTCINEETPDGSATYLMVSDSSSDGTWTYGTSRFGLSSNGLDEKISVEDCTVVLVPPSAATPIGNSSHEISLFIDNVKTGTGYITVDATTEVYRVHMPEAGAAINDYINTHGAFPPMSIEVTTGSSYATSKTVPVNNVSITQLYVELVCV